MQKLKRKIFIKELSELLDKGVFTATAKDIRHYDAGMNFLGVLGEVANHQITDRPVRIFCTWKGEVSPPLPYDSLIKREPNILYDYNGSGNHFQNKDPRYLLPIGSSGLLLNRVEFHKPEAEEDFWFSRQNFLGKLFFKLKSKDKQKSWVKEQTNSLNACLATAPKQIFIKAPDY